MRFGIKANPQNTTWTELRDLWLAADRHESFDSAWSFDHFYPIFSDPTGPCLEGWTTLAALAESTTRIRVGLMVTGMPYRHPAVVANMACAVDAISEGRLELGLGAGWHEEESAAYGISLGRTLSERFDMFDEGVEAIVGLLTNDTTTLHGEHVRLTAARNSPKPVQSPHPPIVIGGMGEKRTLRTAARFAQHWNFPMGTVDEWRHKRDVLHGHCRDTGRDPREITTSTQVFTGPDADLAEARDQVLAWREAGLDVAIFHVPPPYDPAVLDRLAELAADVMT